MSCNSKQTSSNAGKRMRPTNLLLMAYKKHHYAPTMGFKELVKGVRSLFRGSRKECSQSVLQHCMSEEEHQNWLNEQLAAEG